MRSLIQTTLLRIRSVYIMFKKSSFTYCLNEFEFNNKRFSNLVS
jgi:hypothetical protein